jgi:hypothetical protein
MYGGDRVVYTPDQIQELKTLLSNWEEGNFRHYIEYWQNNGTPFTEILAIVQQMNNPNLNEETTLNNFNNEERSLNVSPIDFDDDDTLVDSSRFSNASDMSNISNISNISNASEMSTISYPDMENYTFDGEGQHAGKKQRKTRKYKLNKRITLKHRGKKHRGNNRTTKRHRNARIKTKKQKGGTCYGNGIGANSYDPNLSIYNTRELNLFPYKPT